MISNKKFGIYCSLPGLLIIVALILYPVIYNLYISLLRYDFITPITYNGIANYKWALNSKDFYNSWKISTLYSLGSAGFTLLFSLMVAHSLRGIRRAKSIFRTLSILPWAAPLIVSGFMWRWIFSKETGILNYLLILFGLTNENIGFLVNPALAMFCGIMTTTWSYIPFMTVLLLAGLESISDELYEAAKIDGADAIQRFWYISLSLNKQNIVIALLIIWMYTFRTPDVFVSLTGGGPGKATYHAGQLLWDYVYRFLNFGRAGAISILLTITIIIPSYFVLSYFLRKGSNI
ncbi:carbohydrate ABC transporter permease [Atribacter laminatus]|uniref:Inner membrane ABC transporter permease protein YcjO n=1 Tax=Atribacter laminatus TaxID=2847778 RepID=A0A7T1AJ15_ATRLM|nr:sugar ABC transporter permease [Atribacter laminatus]QPM66824.1 Inner membrane ABC transporter permease protein YcjO [Atribacter laminatus]